MTTLGFASSLHALMVLLAITLVLSLLFLQPQKTSYKPKFSESLSKSRDINLLSGARFFLFGSRDIWFVIALPVFFQSQLQWTHLQVGSFMACWVIGYGLGQALAPKITSNYQQQTPTGSELTSWVAKLAFIPALIAAGLIYGLDPAIILIAGLLTYGVVFAINSSIHSFLIVAFSKRDSVSTDVGFYYMANAAGRLSGTLLSGLIYQQQGLVACLAVSSAMVIISTILSAKISR